MAMKIYGSPLSGRTARVLAVLFEKEMTDFEVVPVWIDTEDVPEFLSTQPFGQTPVLVDGPLTLFGKCYATLRSSPFLCQFVLNCIGESRAIARYIALKFEDQGTALYGTTLAEKAVVEQWMEVEAHKFNPPIAIISREKLLNVAKGGQPNEAIVEANIVKLGEVLDVYDGHLKKSKYLAGDFFSLADLCHLPYIDHLINRVKRGKVIEARPHVKAWWEDISSRPAWKKVLALIQEEFKPFCSNQNAEKSFESLKIE